MRLPLCVSRHWGISVRYATPFMHSIGLAKSLNMIYMFAGAETALSPGLFFFRVKLEPGYSVYYRYARSRPAPRSSSAPHISSAPPI
jgi:hypothetical protein